MRPAALRFPRCTQMKISVSKSTETASAELIEDRFNGSSILSGHAEKGVARDSQARFTSGRHDRAADLSVVEDRHRFASLQGTEYVLHPVTEIHDRGLHPEPPTKYVLLS